MSRRVNCWDNACMERFMNSYKNEWMHHQSHLTLEDVHRSTFAYSEIFYNRRRRHQALDYVSLEKYEQMYYSEHAA